MTNPTTSPIAESLHQAIARLEKDVHELEHQLDDATEETLRKETAADEAITAALIEPSPAADTAARAAKAAATASVEREEDLRRRIAEVRRAIETAVAKLEREAKEERSRLVLAVRADLRARMPQLEAELHRLALLFAAHAKLEGRPHTSDAAQLRIDHHRVFREMDNQIAALIAEAAAKETTDGQ